MVLTILYILFLEGDVQQTRYLSMFPIYVDLGTETKTDQKKRVYRDMSRAIQIRTCSR